MSKDFELLRRDGRDVLRVACRGRDVLNNPIINFGTAFTTEQRKALGITGLLPNAVISMDAQLRRVYRQFSQEPITGQRDGTNGDLLCFEHVCRNETNAEEDAEKHEQHTHLSCFLFHFLVFYEVYQALGLYLLFISGCKITTFLSNCQIFTRFFA